MIASLLETCKLNGVDPLAWMTDVLTKLVNLWPASRIAELMPWAYAAKRAYRGCKVGRISTAYQIIAPLDHITLLLSQRAGQKTVTSAWTC